MVMVKLRWGWRQELRMKMRIAPCGSWGRAEKGNPEEVVTSVNIYRDIRTVILKGPCRELTPTGRVCKGRLCEPGHTENSKIRSVGCGGSRPGLLPLLLLFGIC